MYTLLWTKLVLKDSSTGATNFSPAVSMEGANANTAQGDARRNYADSVDCGV